MRKVLRIVAVCYVVYLGLVLLVVTPALNLVPPWLIKKYYGREFQSDIIYFNPFTLSLELPRTELAEKDGTPFVSLDGATVDLSLASIWSGALVLDELSISQLYAHVVEERDGSFNFSDMLPPEDSGQPEPDSQGVFGLTIHHFDFHARQLAYTSRVREKDFTTDLNDLQIIVHGISTVKVDGEPYTLTATGDHGGTLHWEGVVSIPEAYSEGTLALSGLHLHPLWRYVEPWVAFDLEKGMLDIQGHYKVDWSEGFDYGISDGEIRLDDITVHPKIPEDIPDTSIALGNLTLGGIELDGPAQHVGVDSLSLEQLEVGGWSEGEKVSLVELFAVELPQENGQQPPAPEDSGTAGWTAELGHFRLADSSLRWRSEFTDPAQLEVTPVEFMADSIKWPLQGSTDLKLSLTVNGQTSASIEGSLDLASGAGQLGYRLAALPLSWFNPNLPEPLNAEITDGQLNFTGEIALADYAPQTLAVDGSINGFGGKIAGEETSLTSWETVRWEKLLVDMAEHRVDLAKLSIDNYTGRIHISEDGAINASNIWQEEVGDRAQEVADTLAEGKPWVVNIPSIHITDSEIDFKDESLPIQFRTVIGEINGDIRDISSKPGAKTRVDIHGSVDGYAPVALAGTAEPLRTPPAIDLELSFDGVDMALLSPYSSTYAGYAIERGVLHLDLGYAMEDNQLKGANRIVINQMKLGEKVASEKAVDLPLELALALLTDSNGVIDLDVPVSGNVEDPQFSVGSVVMGALVNLITKAVTSPFTLLAGLVDTEEDLQRLNFPSGSAELQDTTRQKLTDLSTALKQRPELKLVITGRLQLKADRERLQKNRLQADLLAAGLPEIELDSKGPLWEKAITERYQAFAPGETELTVGQQYQALARNVSLPDTELLALASARAVAVKAFLVNEAGLSPEIAAIAKSNLDPEANLYSGAELEIEI